MPPTRDRVPYERLRSPLREEDRITSWNWPWATPVTRRASLLWLLAVLGIMAWAGCVEREARRNLVKLDIPPR